MEMVKCMLFEKRLPKKFWAEVVNTLVYLQNLLPTKALKDQTSYKTWYGFKPSVEHWKVFGYICYHHIPTVKRSQLDQRIEVGIFILYSLTFKGYRILNPKTMKIQVSRDVHFTENEKWNQDGHQLETPFIKKVTPQLQDTSTNEMNADGDDKVPARGTKSLEDVYERCNFASLEPTSFKKVAEHQEWRQAMQREIKMIEKNHTWKLVQRPKHQKVIGVR